MTPRSNGESAESEAASSNLPATWNPLRLIWRAARGRMLAQLQPVVLRQLADEQAAHLQIAMQGLREELQGRMDKLRDDVEQHAWWVAPANASVSPHAPFMQHSTCAASDLTHPRYREICRMLNETPRWHRKQWEWVFIAHHLLSSGVVRAGNTGVVFGVGREMLPALFAKHGATIIATDAPEDLVGWAETNQHSQHRDHLRAPSIVADADFDRLVTYRPADMNAIPDDLRDYDFTWSSCCFEHLGSLQNGMDFVVDSVRRLRPGGMAVHTTEYNVCSDDQTLVDGPTVIYRRRDFEALIERLRGMGFDVEPFTVSPNVHIADSHVDLPPYALPHLKMQLANYVTTSAGVVVRRPA
jgi:hypothetical protein